MLFIILNYLAVSFNLNTFKKYQPENKIKYLKANILGLKFYLSLKHKTRNSSIFIPFNCSFHSSTAGEPTKGEIWRNIIKRES